MENAEGCFNLGFMYDNAQGVDQSYSIARTMYGKACELGNQKGCAYYADLNKKGY